MAARKVKNGIHDKDVLDPATAPCLALPARQWLDCSFADPNVSLLLPADWFEIFECVRKILLILLPIFFEAESSEQLTCGLVVCFVTFGM